MKKKTLLHKTGPLLAAALLLGASFAGRVAAQPFVIPPSLADNFVAHPGYANSSNIDYTPFCTGGPCMGFVNPPQFAAIVTDAGAGSTMPVIMDLSDQIGGWLQVVLPFIPPGSAPDVTVGNNTAILGDYYVAIAANVGGNINLYVYDVAGVSSGTFTLTGPTIYNISTTGTCYGPPHIDIEAQYSNLYMGYPMCNNFAITWQDAASGIWCYASQLNLPGPGVGTLKQMNTSLAVSSPDVAMVERYNPGTLNYEDWTLLAYADMTAPYPGPHTLYYQEWNTATVVVPPAMIYDNNFFYLQTNPNLVSTLRIDGIDNHQQNNPGPSVYPLAPPATNAFFDIVVSSPVIGPPGGAFVLEYNNITGSFVGTDITSPIAALTGNKNLVPVVACGPGAFYSVAYYTVGGFQDYLATSVDWSTGIPTTDANAYQMNTNPWGPSPGFPFGVGVSGTSNNDGTFGTQQLLGTWNNGGIQWDKYSATAGPYSFKHTPNAAPAVVPGDTWQLSPNPATDHVTLATPAGFMINDAAMYRVTDLSGKTLLESKISSSVQQINVNDLPPGMYMVNVYGSNMNTKTIKFVKE